MTATLRQASPRGWERQIRGVTGYRNPTPPKPGMMRKCAVAYEAEHDGYRFPQGQLLAYATARRQRLQPLSQRPHHLSRLPAAGLSCTSNAGAVRLITRHVGQDARERNDANRLTA